MERFEDLGRKVFQTSKDQPEEELEEETNVGLERDPSESVLLKNSRLFACPTCGKESSGFCRDDWHESVTLYTCPYCGKAFAEDQGDNL